jgi:DNA-binding MarR family transcriptional regulator
MPSASEPSNLDPRPPLDWLKELGRRFPSVDPTASLPVMALLRTARAIAGTVSGNLARLDLTEARFTLVMMIYRFSWEQRQITPSQLAREAGIGRAAMTQMLDGLEASGWIVRRMDGDDRRRIAVQLTEEGRRRLEGYLPQHYSTLSRMLAGLSRTQRQHLVRLLAALDTVPDRDQEG